MAEIQKFRSPMLKRGHDPLADGKGPRPDSGAVYMKTPGDGSNSTLITDPALIAAMQQDPRMASLAALMQNLM
jgi:hypothetical protein